MPFTGAIFAGRAAINLCGLLPLTIEASKENESRLGESQGGLARISCRVDLVVGRAAAAEA